jgi:hypothetical protein
MKIGASSRRPRPNQADFQNFFASLNKMMIERTRPIIETIPKTRFIALNIAHGILNTNEIKDRMNRAIAGVTKNQNRSFFHAILKKT